MHRVPVQLTNLPWRPCNRAANRSPWVSDTQCVTQGDTRSSTLVARALVSSWQLGASDGAEPGESLSITDVLLVDDDGRNHPNLPRCARRCRQLLGVAINAVGLFVVQLALRRRASIGPVCGSSTTFTSSSRPDGAHSSSNHTPRTLGAVHLLTAACIVCLQTAAATATATATLPQPQPQLHSAAAAETQLATAVRPQLRPQPRRSPRPQPQPSGDRCRQPTADSRSRRP